MQSQSHNRECDVRGNTRIAERTAKKNSKRSVFSTYVLTPLAEVCGNAQTAIQLAINVVAPLGVELKINILKSYYGEFTPASDLIEAKNQECLDALLKNKIFKAFDDIRLYEEMSKEYSLVLFKGGGSEDGSDETKEEDKSVSTPAPSRDHILETVNPPPKTVVEPASASLSSSSTRAGSTLGEKYSPSSVWKESLMISYEGKDVFKSALEGTFFSGDKVLLNAETVLQPLVPFLDNLVGIIPLDFENGHLGWTYRPLYYFSDSSMLKHHKEPMLREEEFLPLYDMERPTTVISSYPSAKTYSIELDGEMAAKLSSGYPMMKESKFFQSYLGLKDIEAQTFVRSILDNYRNGDNHLTFFVRGWLFWMSANTSVNTGGETYRGDSFDSFHYRSVTSISDLVMDLRSGNTQLIWADDPDINYVHFLTTLSHNTSPVYVHYVRIKDGGCKYITKDSLIGLETQRNMIVAGTYDHQLDGVLPSYVNDPMLIKSYLIRYASSLGIGEQLFDAMKIAFYMSDLMEIGMQFRCPEPLHYNDMFHWVTGTPVINPDTFSLNQFAGVKHKLSTNLLSRMIALGISDFQESIMAERLNPMVERLDEMPYMDLLTMDRISLERMFLGFVGSIVGFDFSVLIHFDVQRRSIQMLDLKKHRQSEEGAFIRTFIPSYPVNTVTSLVRDSYKLTFADIGSTIATTGYDDFMMFNMMRMLDDGSLLDVKGVSWYYPIQLKQHVNIPPSKRDIWMYLKGKSLSLKLVDLESKLPDRYIHSDRYHDAIKSIGKSDWSKIVSQRDNLILADVEKRRAKYESGPSPVIPVSRQPTVEEAEIEVIEKPKVLLKQVVFQTSKSKDTKIDVEEQNRVSEKLEEAKSEETKKVEAKKVEIKKPPFTESLDFKKALATTDASTFSKIELDMWEVLRKIKNPTYSKMLDVQQTLIGMGLDIENIQFDKLIRYASDFLEDKFKGKPSKARTLSLNEKKELLVCEKKMAILYPDLTVIDYKIELAYSRYFDRNKWRIVDCGAGGDCGPNVASYQVCRFLGKGKVSSREIRKIVAAKFGLLSVPKEWWDEFDFLAVAVIFNLGLAILNEGMDWRFLRYGNKIMTINFVGGNHWQAVVPDVPKDTKPENRSYPPKVGKVVLRKDIDGKKKTVESKVSKPNKEKEVEKKEETKDSKIPVAKDDAEKLADIPTVKKPSGSTDLDRIIASVRSDKKPAKKEKPAPKKIEVKAKVIPPENKSEIVEENKKPFVEKVDDKPANIAEKKAKRKQRKKEEKEKREQIKKNLMGSNKSFPKKDPDEEVAKETKTEAKKEEQKVLVETKQIPKLETRINIAARIEGKSVTEFKICDDANINNLYREALVLANSKVPYMPVQKMQKALDRIDVISRYTDDEDKEILKDLILIFATSHVLFSWGLEWPKKWDHVGTDLADYITELRKTNDVTGLPKYRWVRSRFNGRSFLRGTDWFNLVVDKHIVLGKPGPYDSSEGLERYLLFTGKVAVSETDSVFDFKDKLQDFKLNLYEENSVPSCYDSDPCVENNNWDRVEVPNGENYLKMRSYLVVQNCRRLAKLRMRIPQNINRKKLPKTVIDKDKPRWQKKVNISTLSIYRGKGYDDVWENLELARQRSRAEINLSRIVVDDWESRIEEDSNLKGGEQ
jgi:hypothetical protein